MAVVFQLCDSNIVDFSKCLNTKRIIIAMGRSYLLAIDESPASKNAARWCCSNVIKEGDVLHLVAVTGKPTAPP
jgi:hypothetical protein